MKKQITKKQHYVPQFYLKRFTDNKGFLQVYDTKNNNFFPSYPKDICFEVFLYETEMKNAHENFNDKYILENQIENDLGNKESEYSKFLNKLISIFDLNNHSTISKNYNSPLILNKFEKEKLCEIVANIYLRHPYVLKNEVSERLSNGILEDETMKVYKELLNGLGIGGYESFIELVISKGLLIGYNGEGGVQGLTKYLSSLNIVIYKSLESNFATSSFPVALSESNTKNRFFIFPLSPQYSIAFTDFPLNNDMKNRILELHEKHVTALNQQYFHGNFIEYIFSNNKEYLQKLVKGVKK